MSEQLMAILIPVTVTVVGTLMSAGLAMLTNYIRTKTKNEKLAAAMDQISEITMTVVRDLEHTVRKKVSDGKLTPDEAHDLKKTAISMIRGQIPKAVETASRAGLNSLDMHIAGKVEQAVCVVKKY